MSINNWINRDDLERTSESILIFVYTLRAATASQLAALLNLERKTIVQYIYRLNKAERVVRTHRLGRTGESLYTLEPKGVDIVGDIIGKVRYYPISKRQGRHWRGLNDIFLRLIQTVGLETFANDLTWYTTAQAKQQLFDDWNQRSGWDAEKQIEEYRKMLAPDARLNIVKRAHCWIEYDNNTEGKKMIREKFRSYFHTLLPIGNPDPIIWVAPTSKRKDELSRWWEEFENEPEQKGKVLPSMKFFVEGEETKVIVGVYSQLLKKAAV